MERDPLTGGPLPRVPTSRRGGARRGRWIIAVLVVTVLGVSAWGWSRRRPSTAPGQSPPSAVPTVASPADIPEGGEAAPGPASRRIIVEVLNASGIRGLGRRATAYLRDQGLDVVYTANAPDTLARDSTLVLDRAGDAAAATRVSRVMGNAPVAVRPDSSRYVHVTVLVGRLWRPPADALYP